MPLQPSKKLKRHTAETKFSLFQAPGFFPNECDGRKKNREEKGQTWGRIMKLRCYAKWPRFNWNCDGGRFAITIQIIQEVALKLRNTQLREFGRVWLTKAIEFLTLWPLQKLPWKREYNFESFATKTWSLESKSLYGKNAQTQLTINFSLWWKILLVELFFNSIIFAWILLSISKILFYRKFRRDIINAKCSIFFDQEP